MRIQKWTIISTSALVATHPNFNFCGKLSHSNSNTTHDSSHRQTSQYNSVSMTSQNSHLNSCASSATNGEHSGANSTYGSKEIKHPDTLSTICTMLSQPSTATTTSKMKKSRRPRPSSLTLRKPFLTEEHLDETGLEIETKIWLHHQRQFFANHPELVTKTKTREVDGVTFCDLCAMIIQDGHECLYHIL